jgi:hypothetical protein
LINIHNSAAVPFIRTIQKKKRQGKTEVDITQRSLTIFLIQASVSKHYSFDAGINRSLSSEALPEPFSSDKSACRSLPFARLLNSTDFEGSAG